MAKTPAPRKRRTTPAAAADGEAPSYQQPVRRKVRKKPAAAPPEPEQKTPVKKKKKLTKKQKLEQEWTGVQAIHASVGKHLKSLVRQAVKESGDPSICTAGEAGQMVIGIPLPSFSLEYLFHNTALPLGRILQLVGIEGSFKSGLATEIGRWFTKYGGCIGWFEHESKYSDDWALSIIGRENEDLMYLHPCDSINMWQAKLQNFIKFHKGVMKGTSKEPGPGMVYPILMVVDSILGKSMEETQTTIDREGSAGRGHPVEAMSITRYMRHIPQKLRQWPMFLILVNHLRPKKDPKRPNVIERDIPGGRGTKFEETWELETRALGKTKTTSQFDVQKLVVINTKNSLGNTHRQIPVSVRWWVEEEDENDPDSAWNQMTVFDWHGSTIELLLGMESTDETKVKKVVDLTKTDAGLVWSKRLGIPQKKAVPFNVAGKMVMENPEVLRALRLAFGIKVRRPFELGVDYRGQVGDEKRRMGRKKPFHYK